MMQYGHVDRLIVSQQSYSSRAMPSLSNMNRQICIRSLQKTKTKKKTLEKYNKKHVWHEDNDKQQHSTVKITWRVFLFISFLSPRRVARKLQQDPARKTIHRYFSKICPLHFLQKRILDKITSRSKFIQDKLRIGAILQ